MIDQLKYRQTPTLLIADVLACLVAFAIAMHLRFTAELSYFEYGVPPWEHMLNALPVMVATWLISLGASGLYARDRYGFLPEFGRLVQAVVMMVGLLLTVVFFYRGFSYSRGFAMVLVPVLLSTSFFARTAVRLVNRRLAFTAKERNRVLLIGGGALARHFGEAAHHAETRCRIAGVLDDNLPIGTEIVAGIRVVGRISELLRISKELEIRGVIITDPHLDRAQQMHLLDICLGAQLDWRVVPTAYELMLDRAQFDSMAGVPLLGIRRSNIKGANRLAKRLFDCVVGSIALLLLSPLMAAIALLVRLTSKGPVLFSQTRIGENGEPFRFYKFRSMRVNNDDSIHREYTRKLITEGAATAVDEKGALYKIAKDPRLTPIGGFIRKYSIDELPQLFNVIKGDMSLIGPRPPIPYEVEVYREWHKRRFEGPPGITGLWQVSGRSRLSFDEMVKLDIEYLENWSFRRDIQILWRTVGVVLFDRAH